MTRRMFNGRFNIGGLQRWPFERFYCGCPLVTTNGFRVGTLCLGGDSPRKMTAHEVRAAAGDGSCHGGMTLCGSGRSQL